MNTKQTLYQTVVDKGFGKEFLAERQAEPCYLISRQRKGWREMAKKSIDGIIRYLPNTEETKNMIDTEGIEVLRHVTETTVQQG